LLAFSTAFRDFDALGEGLDPASAGGGEKFPALLVEGPSS